MTDITDEERAILATMALTGWPQIPIQCQGCGGWTMHVNFDHSLHLPLKRILELGREKLEGNAKDFATHVQSSVTLSRIPLYRRRP